MGRSIEGERLRRGERGEEHMIVCVFDEGEIWYGDNRGFFLWDNVFCHRFFMFG